MNNRNATIVLENLGFDAKETTIYLTLLRIGESSASKIAKESGIERTLCYYVIEKLTEKGLISYSVKSNVKHYRPVSPKKIQEDLEDKKNAFQEILPQLEKLFAQKYHDSVSVEVFKGTKGFMTVINDMFRISEDFLVIGEEGLLQEKYPIIYKQYLRKLKDYNVKEKVLVRDDLRGKIWKSKNSTFRYLPKDQISPTSTLIYGDKVLITIWEEPLYNILISSNPVALSYRSYFQILWKKAKK